MTDLPEMIEIRRSGNGGYIVTSNRGAEQLAALSNASDLLGWLEEQLDTKLPSAILADKARQWDALKEGAHRMATMKECATGTPVPVYASPFGDGKVPVHAWKANPVKHDPFTAAYDAVISERFDRDTD